MAKVIITIEDNENSEEDTNLDISAEFDPPVKTQEDIKFLSHKFGLEVLNFIGGEASKMSEPEFE